MCQAKVLKYLEKNGGEWITSRYIADKMKMQIGKVSRSLAIMYKYNEIDRKERNHIRREYLWRAKE